LESEEPVRCVAIAVQLCFGKCRQEGVTLKRYTAACSYADYVNMLGGSVHAMKKNTETLVVASKEIGLEVNAEKTKYMVMSGDRNVGQQN
jgi:hypothetical protein